MQVRRVRKEAYQAINDHMGTPGVVSMRPIYGQGCWTLCEDCWMPMHAYMCMHTRSAMVAGTVRAAELAAPLGANAWAAVHPQRVQLRPGGLQQLQLCLPALRLQDTWLVDRLIASQQR